MAALSYVNLLTDLEVLTWYVKSFAGEPSSLLEARLKILPVIEAHLYNKVPVAIPLLDQTLAHNWDLTTNGQHKLIPEKVAAYLASLEAPDAELAQKILSATVYYTYSEFRTKLLESLAMFERTIGNKPFWIWFVKEEKWGSEHWLTALLWPRLRYLNAQGLITNWHDLTSRDILIIDDAMYSGVNVANKVDNIHYDNLGQSFQCHLLVPFTTYYSLGRLAHLMIDEEKRKIPTPLLYSKVRLVSLDKLFPVDEETQIRWFIEDNPTCVYFDHKVANEFGSFPQIYLRGYNPALEGDTGLLLEKMPDRSRIQALATLLDY